MLTAADVRITDLDNDSLIVRLHFTINHLSRWISPVKDRSRLERTTRRGEPTVKELLLEMRDEELRTLPKLHMIAIKVNPNLDELPPFQRSEMQRIVDERSSSLAIMAEIRRARQGTCSLLRTLPDSAWLRVGSSRREHDWQVRSLAEHLAQSDMRLLHEIDLALDRSGARENISSAAKTHLEDLLRMTPVTMKRK